MTKALTLRLPDWMHESVREEAFERRVPMTTVIMEAIQHRLKQNSHHGCDVCGKPHVHVSTPGGIRFCAEHYHPKPCSNKDCRLEYAHDGPCWDRTLDPCPTCGKNNGHFPHCPRIDDEPCPKCSGDRLRSDFAGGVGCHAHTRKERDI